MDENATGTIVDREAAATRDRKLQLRLWLRLLTCSHMIETEIRSRLRVEFQTTLARFDVLAQLDAASGTLSMGELSARLMVTNGNVTGLIAGMAKEGLVSRLPHPTDGRSTLIGLTPAGEAFFRRMAPRHEGWVDELMLGMARNDMVGLMDLLGSLKRSVGNAAES
jgi:DNA-binding MarR family transcriptional regulator